MNYAPASAMARLLPDGTAEVTSAASDMGPGTWTSMTQVAAETLGLPIERVKFTLGDTRLPRAPVHGGSMTMASVGSAVQAACRKAREDALARGGANDLGEAMRRIGQPVEASADVKPGDARQRFSMHAFGAVFVEVAVDPDLGETRVRRIVGAYGAGRIVNPKTTRSQCIGGMIGGIGMALMEHSVVDARNGRVVNANFAEYAVPVHADAPPVMDVIFVEEHDPHVNPLGVKGVGEIAMVGVAPAITNAIFHATGKRIRELPVTPDKLLKPLSAPVGDVAENHVASPPRAGGDVAPRAHLALEDGRERVLVRDVEHAERGDRLVDLDRVDARRKLPSRWPRSRTRRSVSMIDRLSERMAGTSSRWRPARLVLRHDQPHEALVLEVVVVGEFDDATDRLRRREVVEIERVLRLADLGVHLLQHREVELLLAAEVVVDQCARGVGPRRDRVHARALEAARGELVGRRLDDARPVRLRRLGLRMARSRAEDSVRLPEINDMPVKFNASPIRAPCRR